MMTAGMYSSKTPEWATPQKFFDALNAEFHFTLDVCATKENAKCARYFTIEDDGLKLSWGSLLPLKTLQLAHGLIQTFTVGQDSRRDGTVTEGTAPVCLCELDSDLGLGLFDTKERHQGDKDCDSITASDIPTPRNALVQLAGLLTGDSANAERIRKELYDWLVDHLHLEVEGEGRRAFLSAGSLSDALLDVYATLAVEKSGAIGQKCIFHTLMIPCIGGFVKEMMEPTRAYCNPPYGRGIGAWVKKAYDSVYEAELRTGGVLVVCLLPARTDTAWWHDYCAKGEVRFIRGRLKFGDGKNSAPFPSAVVIFKG